MAHHLFLLLSKTKIFANVILTTRSFIGSTSKLEVFMRFLSVLYLIAIVLDANPTFAQDSPWNCDDAGSLPQQGMNFCAFEDWQRADEALNAAWPQVKAWAKSIDEDTRPWRPELAIAELNLLKAQRAWINYRDGHCETEGMKFSGGTLAPLIINSCKASITRKRTEELLLLLQEG